MGWWLYLADYRLESKDRFQWSNRVNYPKLARCLWTSIWVHVTLLHHPVVDNMRFFALRGMVIMDVTGTKNFENFEKLWKSSKISIEIKSKISKHFLSKWIKIFRYDGTNVASAPIANADHRQTQSYPKKIFYLWKIFSIFYLNFEVSFLTKNLDNPGQTSLGNVNGIPVAIGGYLPNSRVIEKLVNSEWSYEPEYPFVQTGIYAYSLATMNQKLYLFGGWADGGRVVKWIRKLCVFRWNNFQILIKKVDFLRLSRIFIFTTFGGGPSTQATMYNGDIWTHIGDLLSPRQGHRSVTNGNEIFHVGGEQTR